jgi:hypothetical protein
VGKAEQQAAVYANHRRVEGERGKSLLRRRGELLERHFAHQYETGAMRRLHMRGRGNVCGYRKFHILVSKLLPPEKPAAKRSL